MYMYNVHVVVQLRLPMSIRYSTFALELYRQTICMIHIHVYMYLINCISNTPGQGRRGWTMPSHV